MTATPATGPAGAVLLPVALAALFVGAAVLVGVVLDALTRRQRPEEQIRRRLSLYTLTGRPAKKVAKTERTALLADSAMARSAVEIAGRVMEHRGLDTALDARLEAAGLPLRTAEWMLLHLSSGVGIGLLFTLLSGGRLAPTVLGLALGLAGPWLFLSIHSGRRESRFLSQLPDALQLIAGSLQAGYSLPQALDTVVREGEPPMSTEFNRALIENKLGRTIEEALDGIGQRMSSRDFSWVVMAIRVQREIGGNLAELLTTVAETLRERERLRRQVKVLSSEGRLSAWILGLLPVVFGCYLAVVKPDYAGLLWSTRIGWVMLVAGVTLLVIGAVWMTRAVKVEV